MREQIGGLPPDRRSGGAAGCHQVEHGALAQRQGDGRKRAAGAAQSVEEIRQARVLQGCVEAVNIDPLPEPVAAAGLPGRGRGLQHDEVDVRPVGGGEQGLERDGALGPAVGLHEKPVALDPPGRDQRLARH